MATTTSTTAALRNRANLDHVAAATGSVPACLEDLLRVMRHHEALVDDAYRAVRPYPAYLDWGKLPNFGGDEPADTQCVWSWDEARMLVGNCADDLEIISR